MIKLNDKQQEIFDSITGHISTNFKTYKDLSLMDRMITLQGKAGSGKSTLVGELISHFSNQANYHTVLTATTHKALAVVSDMTNDNVMTSTIHSYLKLKVSEDYNTGEYNLKRVEGKYPEPCDILLIDECSMCDTKLFDFILEAVLSNTVSFVIFVGDSAQLLPVNGELAPIFDEKTCIQHSLTEIVRQSEGNPIITLASKIRKAIDTNSFPEPYIVKQWFKEAECEQIINYTSPNDFINRYYSSEYKPEENLIVAYKNNTVDRLNKSIRKKLIGADECFIIGEELIFNEALVEGDDTIVKNNEKIKIKELTKHYDKELDIHFWKILTECERVFRAVDFGSRMDYDYELGELAKGAKKASGVIRSQMWRRYFELKNSFGNVAYIYTTTSHKSQGSSCREVFVDIQEILGMSGVIDTPDIFRSLYVSVTRCKYNLIVKL